MISQESKANPDLLLFDSGDFSQGSPYYSLFKGDVEVGLMLSLIHILARTAVDHFDRKLPSVIHIDARRFLIWITSVLKC